MDNAALIDDEQRSNSDIPLVRRLSSSAGLSSPRERPAASCNPSTSGSGGNVSNAAQASGQEHAVAMPTRSTSPASTAAATADEDVSKLDLAIMACTITLLMSMAIAIGGLAWKSPWKVLYGSLMIVSFVSTIIGFLTAVIGRPKGSKLSPSCARLGLLVAAALFVVFLSCKLARFGCLGGVAAAAVVVVVLAVAWVLNELPIADAAAAQGVDLELGLTPS